MLKNQDEFVYHTKQGFFTGKVYDIDNSKDANKTSDVTVYQKQKRG